MKGLEDEKLANETRFQEQYLNHSIVRSSTAAATTEKLYKGMLGLGDNNQ